MSVVVAERTFPEPMTPDMLRQSIREGQGCNALYGVTHLGSLLLSDGRRTACFYRAPDAEVVRGVSRTAGAPYDRVWSATVHGGEGEPILTQRLDPANGNSAVVLVSRSFAAPIVFGEIQAQEEAQAWCLKAHRVRFLQSYLSFDRKRMLCLYEAPDAEAVRQAQHGAGLPFDQAASVVICRA